VWGQADGGQHADVAEARNHHPPAGHAVTLRGGRGTNRETRSITC
jgi:hypothetical protein